MKIAQLAPLIESVPPDGYGGTELVVSLLTEELVRRGHEVTLFATGDSSTSARLVSVVSEGLRKACPEHRYRWPAYDLRSLLKLKEMSCEFDIVHNHMGYPALPFLEALNCPVVTTNHNPISDYCADAYLAFAELPYISISDSYRRLNYPNQLNYIATVYNGIDTDRYFCEQNKTRSYLLFIGRISAAKGTSVAIDIAQRLGLPIKLAGKIDASDEAYFANQVKSKLAPPNVEFLGEVTEQEKVDLYRGAIATLYPINFEEPFGLVMAESLASGTPVLALNRGSVQEVVSDQETGIIAETSEQLLEKFIAIESLSADACRTRARELFGKERMTQQYEFVYKQLMEEFRADRKQQEQCVQRLQREK